MRKEMKLWWWWWWWVVLGGGDEVVVLDAGGDGADDADVDGDAQMGGKSSYTRTWTPAEAGTMGRR